MKNMKIMFSKRVTSLLLATSGVLLMASCSKVNDLYKAPEKDPAAALFPNVAISDKFNWATSKQVDVRIGVEDQFDGQYSYKLEVYDSEPFSEGALLLAGGLAKKGQDLVTKATIPTVLDYVFVKQTSPTGLVSYFMAEVNGNSVRTESTGATKVAGLNGSKGLTLLASTTPTIPAAPVVAGSVYTGSGSVSAGNSYKIPAGSTVTGKSGFSGVSQYSSTVTLFVEGTWDLTNQNVSLPRGVKIVVMPTGKLKISNDKDLVLPVNSVIQNYGHVDIKGDFDVDGGTFLNYGAATIDDLDVSNNSLVENYNSMVINEAKFEDSRFNVYCDATVNKTFEADGSIIYVAKGVRLMVLNSVAEAATFELDDEAIFQVTGKAEFSSDKKNKTCIIRGVGAKKALASMKEVRIKSSSNRDKKGGKRGLDYEGNLNIAYDKHDFNGRYETNYKCGKKVRMYGRCDDVKITIPEDKCGLGTSTPVDPNPPAEPPVTPIELGYTSYAFEDNWPSTTKGDYDMNDFVVDVQIVQYKNAQNKIEKVVLRNKIRSVGASKDLSAAIQLEGVAKANVKDVDYSNVSVVGAVLPLEVNGLEAGQTKPIVTIADNAHGVFGVTNNTFVSTQNGSAFTPVITEVTIEFNTPIENFDYENINPFISYLERGESVRSEVHVVGFLATNKINNAIIARETDPLGELSAQDPFKSKRNEPFAVRVPGSFVYPGEGVKISTAYPRFESWVTSGGTTDQDWFISTP